MWLCRSQAHEDIPAYRNVIHLLLQWVPCILATLLSMNPWFPWCYSPLIIIPIGNKTCWPPKAFSLLEIYAMLTTWGISEARKRQGLKGPAYAHIQQYLWRGNLGINKEKQLAYHYGVLFQHTPMYRGLEFDVFYAPGHPLVIPPFMGTVNSVTPSRCTYSASVPSLSLLPNFIPIVRKLHLWRISHKLSIRSRVSQEPLILSFVKWKR